VADEPAPELLDPIRAVIRMARIAQSVCEQAGLNLAQYRALHSAVSAGQRAYELAQATAVSRPAISSLTNGMVKAGLIAREASPGDGRGVVFVITDLGLERLQTAERMLVERFAEVLGDAAPALARLETAELQAALDRQADRDFGKRA
jgi:DNA-binding MarR family transcriptional regulator